MAAVTSEERHIDVSITEPEESPTFVIDVTLKERDAEISLLRAHVERAIFDSIIAAREDVVLMIVEKGMEALTESVLEATREELA